MSINVETIGEALMVQHFAEVREPHFCRLTSISDAITTATNEFLTFIEKNGVTFEQARAARQQASDSHNHKETPNFAKSIESRSLSRS
jgi:hypothetical protein